MKTVFYIFVNCPFNSSFKTKPHHYCHLLEYARQLRKDWKNHWVSGVFHVKLLNSAFPAAQLWRPSVVQRSKWAGGDVIISQQSKCEGQSNRGSPASLHAGKLQQEERVSYARAERFGHSTLPRVNRGGADADKSSIPFFPFTHHFLEPWALG